MLRLQSGRLREYICVGLRELVHKFARMMCKSLSVYARANIWMHVCAHVIVCVCLYVCVCLSMCVDVRVCICVLVLVCAYACVRMCVFRCAYIRVCACDLNIGLVSVYWRIVERIK